MSRARKKRRELERYTDWIKRTGKLPCLQLQHGAIRPSESAIWQFRHKPYAQRGEADDQQEADV